MIVTNSLIERIKTRNGGFTKIQAQVLGVYWPLQKGWKSLVIGDNIKDWRVLFYERDQHYPEWFKKGDHSKGSLKKLLDVTYSDTWQTRSKGLDNDYGSFLKSDHWTETKNKAKSRPSKYSKCLCCGSSHNIELHHKSYKFINTKNELLNIVPLCREHHQEVHDYAKEEQVSVRIATNKMIEKYCHVKPANV